MASLTRWTWVCVNPGVGDGQGGLACCDSWSHKESDLTEQLNWTDTQATVLFTCIWRNCKPWKSSLLNIKETMYWPRYLIYSTSIRRCRGELQDPKTGLCECLYSVPLCSDTLCREILSSDFSFTGWKDTCSWTALYWHICTAHDQREKAPSFNYLHLKVSKELARKVGLGHKPCPGATVLVCYTRQGGQDIQGHRLTLVTRRAAFCVHYTHLQG